MAQGKHLGKVVISLAAHQQLDTVPVRGEGSYLVTGGFGGLGLKVAGWLADRGASHIVLTSRRDSLSDEAQQVIHAIQSKGARSRSSRATSRASPMSARPGTYRPARAAAARCDPRGGGAWKTASSASRTWALRTRDGPEGFRRVASASANAIAAVGLLRVLLVGRLAARFARPGQLRRGQRLLDAPWPSTVGLAGLPG
jgi:NAD(P)-dependent dehydrogenase (short-subunit alcohol dehydrogenase family)